MSTKSDVKNLVTEVADKVESTVNSHEQSRALSETADHLQKAAEAICNLVGSFSSATSQAARTKLREGKEKVLEAGQKVETTIAERPLVSIGVAFAAGWLVSRLIKSS